VLGLVATWRAVLGDPGVGSLGEEYVTMGVSVKPSDSIME
jgi:hypothetical protein